MKSQRLTVKVQKISFKTEKISFVSLSIRKDTFCIFVHLNDLIVNFTCYKAIGQLSKINENPEKSEGSF